MQLQWLCVHTTGRPDLSLLQSSLYLRFFSLRMLLGLLQLMDGFTILSKLFGQLRDFLYKYETHSWVEEK